MVRAQASTLIRRDAEHCFRFVAVDFFRNYPRWSPEVVELRSLSPGPLRVGTLGCQVRVDFGRRTAATFRVTALEQGRRLAFQGTSKPFVVEYRFESLDDRTRVTFTFVLQRLDLPLRPLKGAIGRAAQASAERVVANLKRLIEAEAA
jgi:hypothetical protein